MKRLLVKLTLFAVAALAAGSFAAGAAAVWLLLRRRDRRRQQRLARLEREQASRRAWALDVERQLAQQAAPPPPSFQRGAVASNGFISVQALAADLEAAANDLDVTADDLDAVADAQALGELFIEAELPLAEVEVLQASYEASQPHEAAPEIDMAALASRSGAVDLPAGDQAGVADDLILIDGIGPVYAARLRQQGIVTFAGLAELSEAALAELIQAPAWRRPNFAAWIDEATQRAAAPVAVGSPITP
jgi:predicted flap endonuclease-1-like 5' DNA nuclease